MILSYELVSITPNQSVLHWVPSGLGGGLLSFHAQSSKNKDGSVLCLMKTFMVKTMYYCNLLCYLKCSTSLLTFKIIALSFYHVMIKGRSYVRMYMLYIQSHRQLI